MGNALRRVAISRTRDRKNGFMSTSDYSTAPVHHVNSFGEGDVSALHGVVADARTKAPVYPGWLQQPATDDQIADADSEPYLLLGHVPGRSGLLVIDIDTDRGAPVSWWADAVEESLGPPVCTVTTQSGGLHLYFRCDQDIGNVCWEGGEIRCAAGHAVLWDEDAVLAAVENLDQHEPVDCSRWPISKRNPGTSASPDEWAGDQIGKVGAALRMIDCRATSYDDWIAVGHALHWADHYGHVEDGLRIWTEWSASDPARFPVGRVFGKVARLRCRRGPDVGHTVRDGQTGRL